MLARSSSFAQVARACALAFINMVLDPVSIALIGGFVGWMMKEDKHTVVEKSGDDPGRVEKLRKWTKKLKELDDGNKLDRRVSEVKTFLSKLENVQASLQDGRVPPKTVLSQLVTAAKDLIAKGDEAIKKSEGGKSGSSGASSEGAKKGSSSAPKKTITKNGK